MIFYKLFNYLYVRLGTYVARRDYCYNRNKYLESVFTNLIEIDTIDESIIAIMVTRIRTSSYSVWLQMKDDARSKNLGQAMAYKSVNKRVMKLARAGLLTEIKPEPDTVNVHGRKDYRVTIEGLRYLIPFILVYPIEVRNIVRYMIHFKIDNEVLKKLLFDSLLSLCDAAYEFEEITKDGKNRRNTRLQRRIVSLRKEALLTRLGLEESDDGGKTIKKID